MKRLNALTLGLVIGLALGLWFGFNLGRDEPIFANPFSEPALQDKLKRTGESVMEKTGEALEKGGQALQKRSQD